MLTKLFSLNTATAKRVFGLDVMRALAILIVVDAHATVALKEYYNGLFIHHLLPDGVELFFVLSGFLIGGILIRSYEKKQRFDRELLLNFWTRRWFRTLPNYYFVLGGLILTALLRAWRSGLHHTLPPAGTLLKYFFFVQNFAQFVPDFFPETWSLAIEEWSYITLPLVLWVMHSLLSAQWSRQRIVLVTILTIIIGTNLYRFITAVQIPISEGELGYRGIVITRLDAISYGVLAAYVRHYFPTQWTNDSLRRRLLVIGLIMTVLASFSASIIIIGYYGKIGIFPAYTFFKRTFYFPLIGVSMALLMPYMDGWRTATGLWARFGIARAITHISLISYSMYLLNLTPIMLNVVERIPTTSFTVGWLKVGLFWALVLVLSTLLYKYFEKPVTELRERLSAKEPTQLVNEHGARSTEQGVRGR
ncbi:acyltransferase family protein [Spirosoma sp. HMF4905]|uniref:Acyltransferase family protein n=1 Tax=Spirosoma arboris TaxID=2682092 RepID=A0A7K1SLP3_9BACT|nr:acyltransferase [Spirosoma arboris]MVM34715.1 acyltransferase family protein [Spirosoma arboris]